MWNRETYTSSSDWFPFWSWFGVVSQFSSVAEAGRDRFGFISVSKGSNMGLLRWTSDGVERNSSGCLLTGIQAHLPCDQSGHFLPGVAHFEQIERVRKKLQILGNGKRDQIGELDQRLQKEFGKSMIESKPKYYTWKPKGKLENFLISE